MCINENIFKFNELGLLPPGCHEVTLMDIKTFFVDNFPESKTRQSRFDCFIKFYNDLLKNVKSCIRLLIDGSFVENKVDPYDIDFIIVIDSKELTIEENNYLDNLIEKKNKYRQEYDHFNYLHENDIISKDKLYELDLFRFGCDFFRIDKISEDHPMYNNYVNYKNYCINWWGHNRENIPKGFLNLVVDYGGLNDI